MKWKADGLLDGSTILNLTGVDQEKLIVEIIRREAEKLVQTGLGSPKARPADG